MSKAFSMEFVGLGAVMSKVSASAMLTDEQVAEAMKITCEPIGIAARRAFESVTHGTGKTAEQIGSTVEVTARYGVTGYVGVVSRGKASRNYIASFVERGTEHVTEYGSWRVPARPWLRTTWDEWRGGRIGEIFAAALRHVTTTKSGGDWR
jgi:hypothetical protein